jgi:hypothetical protein
VGVLTPPLPHVFAVGLFTVLRIVLASTSDSSASAEVSSCSAAGSAAAASASRAIALSCPSATIGTAASAAAAAAVVGTSSAAAPAAASAVSEACNDLPETSTASRAKASSWLTTLFLQVGKYMLLNCASHG